MPTFSDNFGRADGNNVDSGWNNPGAVFPNFDIFGAALRVRGGIGAIVLVWDQLPATSKQFSQATAIEFGGPPEGTQAGLCIRSSVGSGGKGLGYFLDRLNAGPIWELVKVGPVSSVQLASIPDPPYIGGTVFKLQVVGLQVTAFANGVQIMTATDPNGGEGVLPAGGRVGFFDLTGQAVDEMRWGGWTGGDIAGGASKMARLRHGTPQLALPL